MVILVQDRSLTANLMGVASSAPCCNVELAPPKNIECIMLDPCGNAATQFEPFLSRFQRTPPTFVSTEVGSRMDMAGQPLLMQALHAHKKVWVANKSFEISKFKFNISESSNLRIC